MKLIVLFICLGVLSCGQRASPLAFENVQGANGSIEVTMVNRSKEQIQWAYVTLSGTKIRYDLMILNSMVARIGESGRSRYSRKYMIQGPFLPEVEYKVKLPTESEVNWLGLYELEFIPNKVSVIDYGATRRTIQVDNSGKMIEVFPRYNLNKNAPNWWE